MPNNLQRLQNALGINDILNSIQLLHDNYSNSRKCNAEVRNDEETPQIKRKKDIEHSPDVICPNRKLMKVSRGR
jgi:hypothetical protein